MRAHAREELGIDRDALGPPIRPAGSSFVSFSAGAMLPLLPWFFMTGTAAIVASVVLGVLGAAGLGIALAAFTKGCRLRRRWRGWQFVGGLPYGLQFNVHHFTRYDRWYDGRHDHGNARPPLSDTRYSDAPD